MKGRSGYYLERLIVLVAVVSLPFISQSASVSYAQARNVDEKKISKLSFRGKTEPIEILEAKSDGKIIDSGESFNNDGDWLRDFSIRFKNVSRKNITHIDITMVFPETGGEKPPLAYSLLYGLPPASTSGAKDEIRSLAPGEVDEMTIGQPAFERLQDFLSSRKELKDLTFVRWSISVIYFEDGSQWSAGSYFAPDPNNPKSFIPVESPVKEGL